MLNLDEAWSRIDPHLSPLPSVRVDRRAAVGRVSSHPVTATLDVPPDDVSAMDGFAVPRELPDPARIAGTIAAGDEPGARLVDHAPDGVLRIMTGAPVPADCDRVIPVEEAKVDASAQTVTFDSEVAAADADEPRRHIRRRGEVSRAGEPLLAAGVALGPATASLLATHGIDEIPVHGTPTVAFATTGTEIVPPEEEPGPGRIRDSHSAFFTAALDQLGIEGTSLGIVPDDVDTLRATIEGGLSHDVLLLSGGVSMGEFDFVEDVLEDLGCSLLFDAVAIQPGKPLVTAWHANGLVFALPGNPASAQVTFWLFVRPALRRLMGWTDGPWADALDATLEGDLPGAKGRDRFLPCSLRRVGGSLRATPRPPRGSHDVVAYGLHDGLVRIPAGSAPRGIGETCSAVRLPGF